MSGPGWYPDPGGSGAQRFWDGARWTGQLRPAGGGQRGPRRGWWLVLAVGLIVLAVLTGLLILGLQPRRPRTTPVDTSYPTPSVSGWDETSTPTPPSGSPSMRPCPTGGNRIDSRGPQLTSGGLQVDVAKDFTAGSPTWGAFIADHAAASQSSVGTWQSIQSLGRIPRSAFPELRTAGAGVISCHTTSGNFGGRTAGTVVRDEAVTVAGFPAWRHRERVDGQRPPGGGAEYDATIVDTGHPTYYTVYWYGFVYADADAGKRLDATWASLRKA